MFGMDIPYPGVRFRIPFGRPGSMKASFKGEASNSIGRPYHLQMELLSYEAASI
jgi:hypothetical protein